VLDFVGNRLLLAVLACDCFAAFLSGRHSLHYRIDWMSRFKNVRFRDFGGPIGRMAILNNCTHPANCIILSLSRDVMWLERPADQGFRLTWQAGRIKCLLYHPKLTLVISVKRPDSRSHSTRGRGVLVQRVTEKKRRR
jgi:hypothetical protein